MAKWLWRCLICEKDLTINAINAGDDAKGMWPNIDGGTISIDFGYGSRFDDMNGFPGHVKHQTCICDDCYEQKKYLIRAVEIETHTIRKWTIKNV